MDASGASMPRWSKVILAILVLSLGGVTGAWLHSSLGEAGGAKTARAERADKPPARSYPRLPIHTNAQKIPPASAGLNHPSNHPRSPRGGEALQASFASLESGVDGSIGLAVVPLGSTQVQTFGPLQVGHAWSSMKVPIVATLMREGGLSAEEEALARSAITASDNEAAAALFQSIENAHGGLEGGSLAVQETLALGDDASTQVATAPPPPGAVSTWGQTEWSLTGSVAFFNALACGRLVDNAQSGFVLSLMEEVIAEQQWGLGQADFPSGTAVAFKAGWGPESEAGGGYLVRQAGVLRIGGSGLVVAMMAEDSSGSFEAGIADIDQVADWVSQHLRSLGTGSC